MPFSSGKGSVLGISEGLQREEERGPSQMEKRLLNIAEAGEWLGLSESFLYKLVEDDSIPHIRIGRAIRFDIKLLEEWIKEDSDEEEGG